MIREHLISVDKNSKSRECHDKNLPSSGHSVLIASIAGILLMILGTVFAKADRAYYSSSLIVVTGLILTQLVFFSVSRGFVLMRQKKRIIFKCLHWRRRAINTIHRSNKHASFQ